MVSENTKLKGNQGGLLSYLAKLGLGDDDLSRVFSMIQETKPGEREPQPTQQPVLDSNLLSEFIADQKAGNNIEHNSETSIAEQGFEATPPVLPAQDTITLYLAEEQQILKEAYGSFFKNEPTINIVGCSSDVSVDSLVSAAQTLKPSAILLGVKTVQRETIEGLNRLREAAPGVGLVLLFSFYDTQGIKASREFSKDTTSGCAYLLKHTVDTVDQLTQVIFSVVEGRIIIDPMVMEGLIKTGDSNSAFLRDLSPRELEVLSWMAKGYRNDTIADVLSRDVKTVERHINNIYSKLHSGQSDTNEQSRHPRVQAALTYLKATGMLPAEQFSDD